VIRSPLTQVPLAFIDTLGALPEQHYEEDAQSSRIGEMESKWNEGEADIMIHLVETLLQQGLTPEDIGVITPYNAQVELLRSRLPHRALEVGSVDGFQGREKEAILISTVRSNSEGEVGFLRERRRMNVAVTRARRLVVIVGDSSTLGRDSFLQEMVDYFQEAENALYLTHEDYQFQLDEHAELVDRDDARVKQAAARALEKARVQAEKEKERERQQKAKEAKQARDDKIRAEIDALVDCFLQDESALSFTFPDDFNAFQRMYVHQVAESKNLLHATEQVGEQRILTIRKSPPPSTDISEEKETIPSLEEKEEVPPVVEKKQEDKAHTKTPTPASTTSRNPTPTPTPSSQGKKKKGKGKKKKNPPTSNPTTASGGGHRLGTAAPCLKGKKGSAREEEDIDSLLASLQIKEPNTCHFGNCTRPTNLLSSECKFCHLTFCHNHSMAEKHGCGDQARSTARREFLQSHSPHKPLNERDKAAARDEIRKKISDQSNSRKKKRGGKK